MTPAQYHSLLRCAESLYVKLPYHNFAHAYEAVGVANDLGYMQHGPDVAAALLFHDVVYVPGSTHNEAASAQLWKLAATANGVDGEIVRRVAYLISNTTVDCHLYQTFSFWPLNAVLDCDLSSLAADYDGFVARQANIISEQVGAYLRPYDSDFEPSAEQLAQSARFLKQFLQKPTIYRTSKAQAAFEDKARANIRRFVSDHA